MSNKLGVDWCDDPVGTRDAFHVPVVVVTCDERVSGSEWVRFVDKEATKVERCSRAEAHALVDPFIGGQPAGFPFYVLLFPGMVDKVRHTFDFSIEQAALERELEKRKAEDPDCAECWVIEDGQLVRQ